MSNTIVEKKKGFFGYRAAVGAFLMMFITLGGGSLSGLFVPSMVAFSGWDIGSVGYLGTASVIGNIIFSIVALKLVSKMGPRKLMMVAVGMMAIALTCYTLVTPGKNIQSLMFMYAGGFITAIGVVFGSYAVCAILISQWFYEKREVVTGIVFSAAAFGGTIWSQLVSRLFLVMDDYRDIYRIVIGVIIALGVIAHVFFIREPQQLGQQPLGWEKKLKEQGNTETVMEGITRAEAIRTPSFWLMLAAFVLILGAGPAFVMYSATWWTMNGLSSSTTASYYSLYVLFGGLSLLASGKLVQKLGGKGYVILIGGLYIGGMFCMMSIPGSTGSTLFFMSCLLCGLAYPMNASMPGLLSQSVFGPRESGAIQASLQVGVYVGQISYGFIMAYFLKTDGGLANGWMFYMGAVAVWIVLHLTANLLSPYVKSKKANKA